MSKNKRRQFLSWFSFSGIGLAGVGVSAKTAQAHHVDTHFEDKSEHRLLYQLNKSEQDYIDHVLFSCGEMLRKYGDNIELVVTVLGPGINLLAKNPKRPIRSDQVQRVNSLAQYGVRFQACGNTMKSMNWSDDDMLDVAEVVTVGVDSIMLLQEQGYSYFSW